MARRLILLATAIALAVVDLSITAFAESHPAGVTVDLHLIQLRLTRKPGVASGLGGALPRSSWPTPSPT